MEWSEYGGILLEKCKQQEIPYSVCFELTPFCNFHCNMCYIRLTPNQAKKQGESLTTKKWIQIANEAKQMGAVFMEITGGEAISRSDFCDLYEAFIKMGYLIHLRTNGYLVNGPIFALLQRFKPRIISVTLYGGSDQTYERVCGISDGFTMVTRNILAMKKAGLNVRLSMTVTRDNLDDKGILEEWAKKNGLFLDSFGSLVTPIRGAKRSIDHLRVTYPEESFCVSNELMSQPYYVEDRDSYMNPFWLCRGFGAMCCVSWDGHMTLCNTFTDIWEDISTYSFAITYRNLYSKLRSLKRPINCSTCKYIEFCAACPSQLQSATGHADRTCEAVCKYARRKWKYYMQFRQAHNDIESSTYKGDGHSEN